MSKRIAVLDSGIGGTSLLKVLLDRGVAGDFFYLADSINVPYGNKSQEFMFERMTKMLAEVQDCEAVVVACNTLTAETIDRLREEYAKPIFGIEPYINYLHHPDAQGGKLALILTQATFQSKRFKDLLEKLDPYSELDIFPLKNLAQLIEDYNSLDLKLIDRELEPLKDKGYTHLILGCTHYPLIKNYIEKGLGLIAVDPNNSVADHIVKELGLVEGPAQVSFKLNIDENWQTDMNLPLVEII